MAHCRSNCGAEQTWKAKILVSRREVVSMELPEPFKTKAREELREDALRKKQSLEQFREWISKQTHFTNCRAGEATNV